MSYTIPWVHVSYTDRAGNDSKADFLIIVKEKASAKKEETKTEEAKTEDTTASSSSSNTSTGSVSTGANTGVVAPNPRILRMQMVMGW